MTDHDRKRRLRWFTINDSQHGVAARVHPPQSMKYAKDEPPRPEPKVHPIPKGKGNSK